MTIEVLMLLLILMIALNILSIWLKGAIYSLMAILLGVFTVAILFYDGVLEITRDYVLSSWVIYTVHAQPVAIGMAIFTVISFMIMMKVGKE